MIKKLIKSIYYKIKKMDANDIRLEHLKKIGMQIGDRTYIFSDKLETAEPYLVTIGNRCMIAPGVMFTTHDASASYYIPGASDLFGRIIIGDDCFIGMGSIILPGVSIANNCIIGAGSVVTKSFNETGIVIAGNPAKKICTIKELYEKNKNKALNVWGMTYCEKKKYLLENENRFK